MAKQSSTKVVTGTVRLSYANVWEPRSINGGTEKYSVSLIHPQVGHRNRQRDQRGHRRRNKGRRA